MYVDQELDPGVPAYLAYPPVGWPEVLPPYEPRYAIQLRRHLRRAAIVTGIALVARGVAAEKKV